jgi:hypothetical protein
MLKLPYSKKSFGLVELIVALAIVVVILTLSTVGINSLKDSFQLNAGTQELFNAISLARVYAENNVTYKDGDGNIKVPDAYMVRIGVADDDVSSNVSINYCNLPPKPGPGFDDGLPHSFLEGISKENITCNSYSLKAIEVDLSGVEILKDQVQEIDGCSEIYFTLKESEMYIVKNRDATLYNTVSCGISVKRINSEVKTRILVNPVNRTIKKL